MGLLPHVYDNLRLRSRAGFPADLAGGTFDLEWRVGAKVPARHLKELVDGLKTHQVRRLTESPAAGSVAAFLCGVFSRNTGIDFVTSPTRTTPGQTDLIRRDLPIAIYLDAGSGRGPVKAGRIRVLATWAGSVERCPKCRTFYGKWIRPPRRGVLWHLMPRRETPARSFAQTEPGGGRSRTMGRIQQRVMNGRRLSATPRHVGRGVFIGFQQ